MNIKCIQKRKKDQPAIWVDQDAAHQHGLPNDPIQCNAYLRQILDDASPKVKTFKDDLRSLVYLVNVQGQQWVVKRYHASQWKVRLYQWVRQTPAWREWSNTQKLRVLGVRVNDVVALVHGLCGGRMSQAMVMPYVDAPSLHHWIRNQSLEGLDEAQLQLRLHVARGVGLQLGKLARLGYVNRDHKASNILIDKQTLAGGEPMLIDLACIKKHHAAKQLDRSISCLWQSAKRAGGVRGIEMTACLRSICRASAPGGRRRLRQIADRIAAKR